MYAFFLMYGPPDICFEPGQKDDFDEMNQNNQVFISPQFPQILSNTQIRPSEHFIVLFILLLLNWVACYVW